MLSNHLPRANMMPRLRRYRILLVCAVLITLLLVQVSRNSQWDPAGPSFDQPYGKGGDGFREDARQDARRMTSTATETETELVGQRTSTSLPGDKTTTGAWTSTTLVGLPKLTRTTSSSASSSITAKLPELNIEAEGDRSATTTEAPALRPYLATTAEDAKPTTVPSPDIPDRKPSPVNDFFRPPDDPDMHIMQQATTQEEGMRTVSAILHWTKHKEWFPVPTESIIPLPTGQPKSIPVIQADFAPESIYARGKREARLEQVKAEMQRAWAGYRTHAWGHDELRPVSMGFADPFCGWAATLVDSLDTLWIMGMTAEFEDALKAVARLDFSTTPFRHDIPVFETTIRYLGGLLGAYDVSGGEYDILLDKAVELAEILMSVFDTPNRMPILYYWWKPAYASQPRRAAPSSSVAELGSMAMEFTRLAQLTGENKYYDAVARITDALEGLQNTKGESAFPGIFPQQLDTSGCNKTADMLKNMATISILSPSATPFVEPVAEDLTDPQGYKPDYDTPQESNPVGDSDDKEDLEFMVRPAAQAGEPATGEFSGLRKRDDVSTDVASGSGEVSSDRPSSDETPLDIAPSEEIPADNASSQSATADEASSDEVKLVPVDAPPFKGEDQPLRMPSAEVMKTGFLGPMTVGPDTPVGPDGLPLDWECTPQNLTVGGWGLDSYSMGGSQDSTYEYFPKQYLLLGGLEPKYRTMHEKVAEAVKKNLLYRPMTVDERDILFSKRIQLSKNSNATYNVQHEVTHLTCFLGGMFALGGKIFNSEEDVEIGARLADGCVWAYEIMPAGIMPETAGLLPCQDMDHCPWNETEWYERLDPNSGWREEVLTDYYRRLKEYGDRINEILKNREMSLEAQARQRQLQQDNAAAGHAAGGDADDEREGHHHQSSQDDQDVPEQRQLQADADMATSSTPTDEALPAHASDGSFSSSDRTPLAKRAAISYGGSPDDDDEDAAEQLSRADNQASQAIDRKVEKLESEFSLNNAAGRGRVVQQPPDPPLPNPPIRPLSHLEFVQQRIEKDNIPPGFVTIMDRRYILRPEAIESVWYMYRITGDPVWQEKGWRMFEAVIKATQTEAGHSAVDDVSKPEGPRPLDSMESFWLAETLKYFYLLFTTPDVISLDDWVLNTEAHPFRRPREAFA